MDFTSRIRAALTTVDDDIIDELAEHAGAIYGCALMEGCDAIEAQRRVDAQIAAWAANAGALRRRRTRAPAVRPAPIGASFAAALRQDVRYAWRLIARQPGYAAVLIGTMALGVAATTVLGSI